MDNRDVTLKLSVVAPGGEDALAGMASATKQLSEEEQKYQERLAMRVRSLQESERMQRDLVRMGLAKPDRPQATPQEAFRQRIDQQVQSMRDQQAARAELIRRGEIAPGMSDILGAGAMRLGAGVAVGGAVVGAAKVGMDATTRGMEAVNNSFITARERENRLVEETIPLFGGLLRSTRQLYEAFSGLSERVRQAQHFMVGHSAEQAGYRTLYGAEQQRDTEQAGADARRRAGRWATRQVQGVALRGDNDRSTYLGDLRYRQELSRLGPMMQEVGAERDLRSAQDEYDLARQQTRSIRGDLASAERDRADKRRQFDRYKENSGTSPATMELVSGQLREANNNVESRALELEKSINREKELGIKVEQQRKAVADASLARKQQELAITRELVQAAEGRQQSFGSMHAGDRMFAVHAAQRLKGAGYDNLTEEEKGIIGRAGGGDVLRKESERSAGRDPLYRQFAKNLGLEGVSDLSKLRADEAKMAVQVTVQPILNENKLGEAIANALGPVLSKLLDNVKTNIGRQKRKAEDENLVRQAAGRG